MTDLTNPTDITTESTSPEPQPASSLVSGITTSTTGSPSVDAAVTEPTADVGNPVSQPTKTKETLSQEFHEFITSAERTPAEIWAWIEKEYHRVF